MSRTIESPRFVLPELATPPAPTRGRRLLSAMLPALRPASRTELDLLRGAALRVLLIHDDALADAALPERAIRALVLSGPGTTIDVVAGTEHAERYWDVPLVTDVIAVPSAARPLRAIGSLLRGRAYDVVVDGAVACPGVTARSAALMLASRAPVWVGEAGAGRASVYNVTTPEPDTTIPYADRVARLVRPLLRDAIAAGLSSPPSAERARSIA